MADHEDKDGRWSVRLRRRKWWIFWLHRRQAPGKIALVVFAAVCGLCGLWLAFLLSSEGGSGRCPNLLIDVGVKTGEDVIAFRNTGGSARNMLDHFGLFPSLLCIEGFEAQTRYAELLELAGTIVRKDMKFGVALHTGTVVANYEGRLDVQVESSKLDTSPAVKIIDEKHIVYNLKGEAPGMRRTQSLPVVDMHGVIAKHRLPATGKVIARIAASIRDSAAYVKLVLSDPRLCARVDGLIVKLEDREDVLSAGGSSATMGPVVTSSARTELELLVRVLQSTSGCQTRVEVLSDETERDLGPSRSAQVFYAILAGAPTFTERIGAAVSSWLQSVPHGGGAVFTNQVINGTRAGALDTVQGHVTVVTAPEHPDTERFLYTMQSWSHLVRVRTAWDLFMRDNPDVLYLALLDDDTFAFTDTLSAVVESCMDPAKLQWGGSTERVRLDNEDGGEFGRAFRELHLKAGGAPCYFPNETAVEGQKACRDTMCVKCPGVPQGGSIVLTRALVAALRPVVEVCERETQVLCKRCGSQRLYFCIHSKLTNVQTLSLRGVYRHPWLSERHSGSTEFNQYPITIHGVKGGASGLHTGSVQGDFAEMYELVRRARRRSALQAGDPFVTIDDLDERVRCNGLGYWRSGTCYAKLQSTDAWCSTKTYRWPGHGS